MTQQSLSSLFYRQPRLTVLALGLLVVAGLAALNSIPRQEDPAITERFGGITTYLPGASAQRVEALITERIENALQEIAELKRINSKSQTGISNIRVQLEDAVTDVDGVWSRISDKLAQLKDALPKGASVPDLRRTTSSADTLLVGFSWEHGGAIQLDLLHRLAKDLQQKLSALGGARKVELYGEPAEEIVVTLDSATMVAADTTATEVSNAIASADAKVSAGRLQNGRTDLIIELGGELDSVNRIRNIPLRQGNDGHFLRIGDVARVEKNPREPPQTKTIIRGKPAIILAVQMENQQRVDRWAASARKVLDRFQATLPAGVSVGILFDQSIHTNERLGDLTQNLLMGAAIVVIILFFMMGLKSALLVASALPLTLLMVLPVLNLLEVPLHQISLTGLIIALGLLIDNAIVVIDDYSQARASGLDCATSIAVTVRHLFAPLAASTVTTTLAFLPLVVLPGNTGEFVAGIGISVILSIVFSLVLSLTIIPALAGYLDRTHVAAVRQGFVQRGFSHNGLRGLYRNVIASTVRRPWVGIVTALAIPLAGFGVATQLVEQFFPPVEAPIELFVYGPDLAELQRLGEHLRLILSETRLVTHTRATIIGGRPKLVFVPDEDEASLAGFKLVDLATQLNANLDGIIGGTVLERTEELPVRVRMTHADRADLRRIVTSTVRAPHQGGTAREGDISGVPLNVIAHASLTPATDVITRRNGERLNIVQAFVEPFSLPGAALADFRRHLAQSGLQLPAGYRLQYGGETEGSVEARAGLISVFLPLLVLMVGTVVLAFNSFRYAAVIGLVAVLSIGGALLTLWIFALPMGFMAVVGTKGLIGLAINDSIVVLAALQADSRAREADDAAICGVVVGATRHIIATSLTTIGGFLPLILWGGTFWPPLAIAVAGGMIGATLLALFFVPPMFAVIVRHDNTKATGGRGIESCATAPA